MVNRNDCVPNPLSVWKDTTKTLRSQRKDEIPVGLAGWCLGGEFLGLGRATRREPLESIA